MENEAKKGRADLEAKIDRFAADMDAAVIGILTDENVSDKEKEALRLRLLIDREDMRNARRVMFNHMPNTLPKRMRIKVAASVARIVAFLVKGVRKGDNKRDRHEAEVYFANMRESSRELVIHAIKLLNRSGDVLDRATFSRYAYSTALNVLAREHGIECADGLFSEKLPILLNDVTRVFSEPFKMPAPIAENTPRPDSELECVISACIGKKTMSLRAQAKMLVDLRVALKLPDCTADQAYQRIRRFHAGRSRS